jgi:hypothetical protein
VATFPESEVRPLAQGILDKLAKAGDSAYVSETIANDSPSSSSAVSLYEFDPNDIHLYILVVDIMSTNVNAVKIRISDFNQKFYSLDDLTISNMFIDNTHQMITVSNFTDKKEAMNYFKTISNNAYVFSQLEGSDFEDFVISVTNYPTFYRSKDVEMYVNFFDRKYGK